MKKNIRYAVLVVLASLFFAEGVFAKTGIPPFKNDYFHAEGQLIVDGRGGQFLIRGVAFGNEVWSNPSLPSKTHHSEADYGRAADMGFNCVRFYLNYRLFEEDSAPGVWKKSGFEWIDRNVAWAKAHDIRLILNMHFPQGGFQSNGNGDALWTDTRNQDRFVALWKEIARRYSGEPDILAFDILNEPVVVGGIDAWQALANRTVDAIRGVDPKHMIIVERMNASKEKGSANWNADQNDEMNFIMIDDWNVAYEFHSYYPMEFTHQNASWIPALQGLATRWPDEDRIEVLGSTEWKTSSFGNPAIPSGTSGWNRFEGVPVTIDATDPLIGKIALQGARLASGTVWFDDVELVEKDETGAVVGTKRFTFDRSGPLGFWEESPKGQAAWAGKDGRNGTGCWKITGTVKDAVLNDNGHPLALVKGHTYAVSGWMRGKDVPKGAEARLRLDQYVLHGSLTAWNKAALEKEMGQYLAFGIRRNVPLYFGEFGCITGAFADDHGGTRWVSDMLDICEEHRINYDYHTWHEGSFGIFTNGANEAVDPAKSNEALIRVFIEKQKKD